MCFEYWIISVINNKKTTQTCSSKVYINLVPSKFILCPTCVRAVDPALIFFSYINLSHPYWTNNSVVVIAAFSNYGSRHHKEKCRPSFNIISGHESLYFFLQCFDIVGLATGRASGLLKAGCWFVGGDDLTGALHVL